MENNDDQYAPIAIFIYNRPDHLKDMLAHLGQCRELAVSPVYVFGDGPRNELEREEVELARKIARDFFSRNAFFHFEPTNKGLAASITGALDFLFSKHDRVIVLEDDLCVSPLFLNYMNAALERYKDNSTVFQVSGFMYNVVGFKARKDIVCLPLITTWGWGTWKRAWDCFEKKPSGLTELSKDRPLRKRFNFDDSYDFSTMLEKQMAGQLDSWGIRWYWSVFKRGGIAVFPPQTLVHNRGFDGTGSHGRGWFRDFSPADRGFSDFEYVLNEPAFDSKDIEIVRDTIWRQNGGPLGYIVDRIKKLVFHYAIIPRVRD